MEFRILVFIMTISSTHTYFADCQFLHNTIFTIAKYFLAVKIQEVWLWTALVAPFDYMTILNFK